jgi:type I restriction enzyme M protein
MGLTDFKRAPIPKKKKRRKRLEANAPEPKLETTLWATADKLRGHMDAAGYKHVVIGLS